MIQTAKEMNITPETSSTPTLTSTDINIIFISTGTHSITKKRPEALAVCVIPAVNNTTLFLI